MPKVTVAVPTYNVEQYLRKCLDSLVAQDYQDMEILVVNDGSPANEQPIIEEYAARYPQVIPVQKENGGYGSVLELAISRSTSTYFMICDPDDWLSSDAVSTLVKTMEESSADLVVGAKNLVYADNDEIKYDPSFNADFGSLEDGTVYQKGSEAFYRLFFLEPSPHAKLYKTDMLKSLVFPKRVSYTDNLLYFLTLIRCDKVAYVAKPCSFYLINREGNTRTDLRPAVIDAWVTVFKSIMDQQKTMQDVPDFFYYRMFETYKFIFNKCDRIKAELPEYQKKLESTYSFLSSLVPYADKIWPFYQQYANAPFLIKLQDKDLLNSRKSKSMFDKLVMKKVRRRS